MRNLVKNYSLLLCLVIVLADMSCSPKAGRDVVEEGADPWEGLDNIRDQIKAPEFPHRDFLITDYGAVGDGKTKATEAFKMAIRECSQSGGGRVVVPHGVYLTVAIHLKSNVNLHLMDSARILFSRDTADYLPLVFSRWEGMELMNYSPFIYAYEQENIAITGNGILDGNANKEYWWPWCGAPRFGYSEGSPKQTKDRDLLHELNHQQVDPASRIFGPGHYLRPQFVQTYKCKNVLISDVKLVNSPMWNIHPVLSENVTIENVKVVSLALIMMVVIPNPAKMY